MKCVMCKGITEKRKVEHCEFGVLIGTFPADVCTMCNETYFDEKAAEAIQKKSKELGVFGLARKVKVAEVGSSIALRIPKEIASFLNLTKGKEVTLMPKDKNELDVFL